MSTIDLFPGTQFSLPTKILQAPDDPTKWFVLEKYGRIRVFDVADPHVTRTYIDFSSKVDASYEGGLLGMAFHPDFPATPDIYVSYTAPSSGVPGVQSVSRLSRITLDNVVSPEVPIEEILLSVNQPGVFHKGGEVGFGPDGFLYFALGDGGSPADEANNGQATSTLLGSIIRIDVESTNSGYVIPPDNPFSGNPHCGPGLNPANCPEVYAFGFRNPWRWSFDKQTGTLWLGDVGDGAWEEINNVVLGGNYGWRCREGAHDFVFGAACPADLIDPVAEYSHQDGDYAIIGGYVYRGQALPWLQGRSLVSDTFRACCAEVLFFLGFQAISWC